MKRNRPHRNGVALSFFDYHLIKSKKRRRTISLQIKDGGEIVIRAPYRTPKQEIERFIARNRTWITEKISEKAKLAREAERRFILGEKFLYLGEWYPLDICESHYAEPPLRLRFGHFILHRARIEEARDLFIDWYKKEAKQEIGGRIHHYAHRLHLFPKGIKITSARSRWGSCSQDNRLAFSWRIIMASFSVIDYVLIHELAHIREKNHSKKFWTIVESVLPDYKKYRAWLREHGHLLEF